MSTCMSPAFTFKSTTHIPTPASAGVSKVTLGRPSDHVPRALVARASPPERRRTSVPIIVVKERNDLLQNAMAITWKSPTLRNEDGTPPFFLAVSLIHGEMRRLRNFKGKLPVRTKRSRAVARALVWGESTFLKVEKFKIKHLTLNFDLVGRSPRPDSVALLSGRLRRPDKAMHEPT